MNNRANKITESLPHWFPLQVYGRDLATSEWHEEIFFRAMTQRVYDGEYEYQAASTNDLGANTNAQARDFFLKWVVSRELPDDLDILDESLFPARLHAFPIHPATNTELIFLGELTKKLVPKNTIEHALGLANDSDKAFHALIDARLKSISRAPPSKTLWKVNKTKFKVLGNIVPLMIDLDWDDDSLKEFFSTQLSEVREQYGPPAASQFGGEKAFEKWKQQKVLEVFDLTLWAKISGQRYTNAFIGKIIWPDGTDNEDYSDRSERIRKTVIPLIKNVFSDDALNELRRQSLLLKFYKGLSTSDKP